MDLWTGVRVFMDTFLTEHGLAAAFVFLLIEEAGVPIPVPGDLVMLLIGIQARQGRISVWEGIGVMEAATLVGSSFLYAVFRWGGRRLMFRYGRFMHLGPKELDRAEGWITRHGALAVVVGRLVPGLRVLTAIACGVFAIPFRIFLPAMSLGALAYVSFNFFIGYFIGPPVLLRLEALHLPLSFLGSLIPLLGVVIWTFRARRDRAWREPLETAEPIARQLRIRAGLAAGAIATIAATLVINILLNVVTDVPLEAPGTLVQHTAARLAFILARDVQPIFFFIAVPAYVLVGIFWGGVFALVSERMRPLPDWLRGMLFSLVPLATSLLVVLPFLGLGIVDVTRLVIPLSVAGETLRHVVYGLFLGLLQPVFLGRALRAGESSSDEVEDPAPSPEPDARLEAGSATRSADPPDAGRKVPSDAPPREVRPTCRPDA